MTAEVEKIVFDLERPVAIERVFDAGSQHKAQLGIAGMACDISPAGEGIVQHDVDVRVLPSKAALAVNEGATGGAHGHTEPGRQRAEPIVTNVAIRGIEIAGAGETGVGASQVRPMQIRLDAVNGRVHLIIVTDLSADERRSRATRAAYLQRYRNVRGNRSD